MKARPAAALAGLALVLAACEGEPAAVGEAGAGAGVKLYTLECGRIEIADLGAFSDDGAYDGRAHEVADSCFLIRHPEGDLLWDSGLPGALAGQGATTNGGFTLTLERTLLDQLSDIGMTAADVDYFAMSHSHFDHTGQAADFAGATWLVDPVEYAWMFGEGAEKGLVDAALVEGLKGAERREVTGEFDLFGDGTVTIVRTPGHTPGHLSLLVKLDEAGPVFLTGDLSFNRKPRRAPRAHVQHRPRSDLALHGQVRSSGGGDRRPRYHSA